MSARTGAAGERVAAALAYVCEHFQEVEELLGADRPDDSDVMLLRRLVEVAITGQDVTELLRELHDALVSRGDATGVFGQRTRGYTVVGVERLEIVYRCPIRRCQGRQRVQVGASSSRCELAGRELLRERLDG